MYAVYLNAPMNSASKEGKIEKDNFFYFSSNARGHGNFLVMQQESFYFLLLDGAGSGANFCIYESL